MCAHYLSDEKARPAFLPKTGAGFDPILGVLDRWRDIRGNTVKGNLVAARSRYVREQHGDEVFDRLAAQLSPEAHAYLMRPPLAFEWCSYGPMMEIDYFIVRTAMRDEVERMEHFGAEIASYDLPMRYRVLFKVGTPGFIAGRLGSAYRAYLRPGQLALEVGDHEAKVRLEGGCYPLYMCQYGIAGWVRSALTLSGGQRVRVEHPTCVHRDDSHCSYHARWE